MLNLVSQNAYHVVIKGKKKKTVHYQIPSNYSLTLTNPILPFTGPNLIMSSLNEPSLSSSNGGKVVICIPPAEAAEIKCRTLPGSKYRLSSGSSQFLVTNTKITSIMETNDVTVGAMSPPITAPFDWEKPYVVAE